MRGTFGPGTYVLGGGALLLGAFLAVGFLLPTDWSADAEVTIVAEPSEVMPFLDSPEGWTLWTTWPDSGLTRAGPERGEGALITWDDRELGSGSFTIGVVDGEASVAYTVRVAGAGNSVMRTDGVVTMVDDGAQTRLRWHEEGDLGANPLMGYWARSMSRAQGAEMQKGLARLAALLAEGTPPPGGSDLLDEGAATSDSGPSDSGAATSDSVPSR